MEVDQASTRLKDLSQSQSGGGYQGLVQTLCGWTAPKEGKGSLSVGACGCPEDEISGNDEDPFPPEMVLKF
jgi:hypothetical protein